MTIQDPHLSLKKLLCFFAPPVRHAGNLRLSDTIQPFPSFSGIDDAALTALRMEIADMPRPARPMDAQMASLPG